jgi:hypothetical protein
MVSLLLKYIPHTLYTADKIHFQESVAEIIVDSEGSLGEKLTFQTPIQLETTFQGTARLPGTVIKVKISGDGAKMTRSTNFIIISFSILNAEDTVMSSKGIFP